MCQCPRQRKKAAIPSRQDTQDPTPAIHQVEASPTGSTTGHQVPTATPASTSAATRYGKGNCAWPAASKQKRSMEHAECTCENTSTRDIFFRSRLTELIHIYLDFLFLVEHERSVEIFEFFVFSSSKIFGNSLILF